MADCDWVIAISKLLTLLIKLEIEEAQTVLEEPRDQIRCGGKVAIYDYGENGYVSND